MKIIIESTPELAHANGLPVRVWTGQTERGTPCLALVTRLAVPDGAPDEPDMLRDLVEPPTRAAAHGEAPIIISPRTCTVCNGRDERRPALFVASGPQDRIGRLQWFECGRHEPSDNLAGVERESLEPIADWFDRNGLPLPDGVYRGPVSGREPWASMLERLRQRDAAPLVVSTSEQAAELYGKDSAAYGFLRRHEIERAGGIAPDPRIITEPHEHTPACYEPNSPCGGEPGEPASAPPLAQLYGVNTLDEARAVHERINESLRTAAERKSPRDEPSWLVKDFHVLYLAAAATMRDGTLPECMRTREALRLQLDRLAPAFQFCESERVTRDEPRQHAHEQAPPMPRQLIDSLIDHPRATGADVDRHTGGAWLAQAYLGALMGWHVRHVHPETSALTARLGAPLDEPDRSAWLTGYRMAEQNPRKPVDDETPPAPDAKEPQT